MKWMPYDPTWLVELARGECPDQPWLAEALARCTRALEQSPAYTYFVSPDSANEPGAEWQFDTTVVLEHPVEGSLVLDILKGGRVGGVEFLARL